MCVSLDQGWHLKSSPVLGTTPMGEKGGLGLHSLSPDVHGNWGRVISKCQASTY